jgi:hypothetical protein
MEIGFDRAASLRKCVSPIEILTVESFGESIKTGSGGAQAL